MIIHPISVIIPTYNRRIYLERAITSVLSQSCLCGEIVIVDDGSTDGTDEFVKSLIGKTGTSIHYLRQDNKGPASARNLGIDYAKFEYIAFLDSDDHWAADKLDKQFRAMQDNPNFLISYTKERWLRNGLHLNQKKRHIPKHGNIFIQCLDICLVGMSTVMLKKELLERVGSFDVEYLCCEDYEFWLRVSCKYPFLLVDNVLTIKEGGREDQVSFQYRVGMDKLRIYAIEKLIAHNDLKQMQKTHALKELVKKATIYGNGCVRHGRFDEGQYYIDRAASLRSLVS